jgi:ATP-binding cassette subfamily C (CFTR/MRP) protein 1
LAKSITKAYSKEFIMICIQTFLFVGFTMYGPIITDQIIGYIEEGSANREMTKGIGLFIGVFFLAFFKLLSQSHVFYNFAIIGFNLSNTLSVLLYEKSLKHPVLCQKKYSVSEIINYSQVDAQRMTYMGFQLTALIFTPIQVLIGLWLMYNFIGISFLSGVGVMVVTIFMTFVCAKISIKANENVLKAKDERMKVTEEIFNIIRFIKVNAFEKYFWQKLNQKRQK